MHHNHYKIINVANMGIIIMSPSTYTLLLLAEHIYNHHLIINFNSTIASYICMMQVLSHMQLNDISIIILYRMEACNHCKNA